VFRAAWAGDAEALVVVGVLMSAVAAFFYFRVVVLMFFSSPAPEGPSVVVPSPLTTLSIALGVAVTLLLGIYPSQLLELAGLASQFVR
jgi:NADH-quinone oxidoreductase subunit N